MKVKGAYTNFKEEQFSFVEWADTLGFSGKVSASDVLVVLDFMGYPEVV